jgi:hypothetical protein
MLFYTCCLVEFFLSLLASDWIILVQGVIFSIVLWLGSVNFMTAVERGLTELRKLGIEQQLWEGSRADIDQASLAMENQ